jgi:predicted lipid-binding transport protein (Tim44 family)
MWWLGLLIILVPILVWARAGGAGGIGSDSMSFSGSGSSDSGTFLAVKLLYLLFSPTPVGHIARIILFFLVMAITAFLIFKPARLVRTLEVLTEQKISPVTAIRSLNYNEIPLTKNQLDDLKNKAKQAFLIIQECWSKKQLTMMRRFISDGVYQRFNAQFQMMNILGQVNIINNIDIRDIRFSRYSAEGNYDCIDVGIKAYADDQFRSEKFPQLNSPSGGEEFIEYWSFIRRKDYIAGKDIFNSENCPKCGAPLNDKLLETARCSYCGVYLNNGEFDWVLCEITQAEDYVTSSLADVEKTDLPAQIDSLQKIYPAFSRHLLEDNASNAFLQIMIAKTTGEANVLQRFMTKTAFEKIKQVITVKRMVYDRLYLSSLVLKNIKINGNIIGAEILIDYCYQMVQLENNTATLVSENMQKETAEIVLMRELSAEVASGSIFANACSSCGATQSGHLLSVCEYCSSPLNNPKYDWIVNYVILKL